MIAIGSLFSGIGGLDLGLESLGLGPVAWQAEIDPYAQAVLRRHWPAARLYDDVRKVDHEAPPVDLVCGGFPCQDISNAGKRVGIDGERSGLWSEYARVLRVVRPQLVFVENVAALAGRGLDRVLSDLAALGFDAEWGVFRASDVGAPHRRERLFILAYANGSAWGPAPQLADGDDGAEPIRGGAPQLGRCGGPLADPNGGRCEVGGLAQLGRILGSLGSVADGRCEARYEHRFPPGPDRIGEWDGPQPAIRRGDDGTGRRVDRLRCLGNAVVPQQAALAFVTLAARALEGRAA